MIQWGFQIDNFDFGGMGVIEIQPRNTARALALLNAVRGRADGSVTFVAGDFANATELVARIMIERRIEFLGEGMRNLDIMRTRSTIPGKATISPVLATAPAYIWPIPTVELLVNLLCEDNPQ